eukprot:SAG11_NODE_6395_length_1322_cov_1.041701_1_plen_332_part_00
MRVSLGQALFAAPTLLLLDEPTNHLDLEACVWLEEHLADYKKCLLVVSHSQDFLNSVCNRIMYLNRMKLRYYSGNYDMFVKLTGQESKTQMKEWEKQQADIEKLKDFIRKNAANKITAKSAKSKEKVLQKILSEAVDKPQPKGQSFMFRFADTTKLPPPVMPFSNVSFSYSGLKKDNLYSNLELGIDCDSRIALVGPNGSGKSTLLKLMSGELTPTEGSVNRHSNLSLGFYHQHSTEYLDEMVSPIDFLCREFPNPPQKKSLEGWRAHLGQYGVTGLLQTSKIGSMSDGQKTRLCFAILGVRCVHWLRLRSTEHLRNPIRCTSHTAAMRKL